MAAFVADASAWNTAAGNKAVAITPAVNDLLVVVCAGSGIAAPTSVTDDQSGTYTQIVLAVRSGAGSYMACYIRDSLVSSAVSHTVTLTQTGDTGGGLNVMRFSGMTKAGATAAKQSAKQDNQASGGTPAPAFGVAATTTNPTVGGFNQLSIGPITEPTGWTERRDVNYATPNNELETVTRDSGFTGTTVTWGSTSNAAFCSLIVELDASAAATASPPGPRVVLQAIKRSYNY